MELVVDTMIINNTILLQVLFMIQIFLIIDLSINFNVLNLSACHVDGNAGDGTAHGTCAAQGKYCFADGTCGI